MSDLLSLVKKKLKHYNVPYESLELSNKPDKKLKVQIDGKVIHFGARDSQTYLEGASKQKRDAYRARHSKIFLKDGTRAIDKLYSPAWLSMKILWS